MQCLTRVLLASHKKINTLFTCGYIVGMIPSELLPKYTHCGTAYLKSLPDNLMLQIVSPRIWLPTMQIVWGVLTFWYACLRIDPCPFQLTLRT